MWISNQKYNSSLQRDAAVLEFLNKQYFGKKFRRVDKSWFSGEESTAIGFIISVRQADYDFIFELFFPKTGCRTSIGLKDLQRDLVIYAR